MLSKLTKLGANHAHQELDYFNHIWGQNIKDLQKREEAVKTKEDI